jgi:hypothetical protein
LLLSNISFIDIFKEMRSVIPAILKNTQKNRVGAEPIVDINVNQDHLCIPHNYSNEIGCMFDNRIIRVKPAM